MNDLAVLSRDLTENLESIIRRCREKDTKPIDNQKMRSLVYQAILSPPGEGYSSGDEQKALNLVEQFKNYDRRKQIAVCLLRLSAEPEMKWLTEKVWRPKLISLFDSQFEENIYADCRIDEKLLGHEKIECLISIVRETERKFLRALGLLTSFEQMNVHRTSLMGVINSKVGRVLVHPFLPVNIEALLGEVYKRIETYLVRREGLGVIDAHSSAEEDIAKFVTATRTKGTLYSVWLADNIGEKLKVLLKEDFRSNKAAQPAHLQVEAIDKKYPFHLIGETVGLDFRVTNQGPGYAYDAKIIIICDDNVEIDTEDVGLGRLTPGRAQVIEIPCKLRQLQKRVDICLGIEWKDIDGTLHSQDFQFEALAQKEDIKWDVLSKSDPYSLEPVSGEGDLVGRKDLLNRLIGTSLAPAVGSSLIQGQKRVGKTSIAKALRSHLIGNNYLVIYVEGGDYVEPTGRGTITRLGNRLCREIKSSDPRVVYMPSPNFDEALSPLVDFLDEVTRIIPERRIVIILDEFDQLPMELYTRGPLGNAFFLTLRSITSRPEIGFVLVGGERMALIMDSQGDQLNKWNVISVDYFSRETDWADFAELVRRPVAGNIEYTNEALRALHDFTAGNPYFTNVVCRTVFEQATKKRDCYITDQEINEAVKSTVEQTARNTFQHFWEDGILEPGDKGAEKSIRRRKILVALSDILMLECPASGKSIQEHPILRNIATINADLREFVSRKILLSTQEDKFEFKVPLLQLWLKGKGVHDVIATFSDLDASMRERQQEEESKIRSTEIMDLVRKWGHYKGQATTEDNVRSWLEQFGGVKDQRLMFKILKNLKYYSNSFVREKMTEIDGILGRSITWKVDKGKFKRSNILVSYMDGPAKSGAHFASLYADEAKIYVENVIEKNRITESLKMKPEVQALVFVDDFVGTGKSASEYLSDLVPILRESTGNRKLKIFFIAVVAYVEGWKNLEERLEKLGVPIEAHACETLNEEAKCFSERSSTFPDPTERESAKKVALIYGKQIVGKNPLGYGDIELAVVFERGCPNNSLPILWSESLTPKWTPLFKRD